MEQAGQEEVSARAETPRPEFRARVLGRHADWRSVHAYTVRRVAIGITPPPSRHVL